MRTLRYIVLNPFGIAFVILHGLIVGYALFGDFPSTENYYHGYTLLRVHLTYVNMPALLVTHLFAGPLIYVFGLEAWKDPLYTSFAILFCSIQWLIVGTLIHFLFSKHFPSDNDPSLKLRSS
jgi:hypothetical protein